MSSREAMGRCWLSSCGFAVAGIILISTSARALDRDRTLAQLHHTAWTAEDGAPTQITSLAQSTDGYLWIGSARGLFRFDGVEFERFIPVESDAVPSHNIGALLATPDGGLWVAFRPSGLGFLEQGRVKHFDLPDTTAAALVYELTLDHDARVWAGTNQGLAQFDGTGWIAIGHEWGLAPSRVRTLGVDDNGTLWVADANGLHSLARGASGFVRNESDVGWIAKMAQDSARRLWLSGSHPLTAVEVTEGRAVPVAALELRAIQMLIDRDGCLWLGLANARGLQRIRHPERLHGADPEEGNPIELMREAEGLSADAAYALFEDREGNIWVGTPKGLDRFRHGHFTPVPLPKGHEWSTLLPAGGGQVFVGSATNNALLRVSTSGIEPMPAQSSVASVYRSRNGVIWWGGYGKILRQEGNSFQLHPGPPAAPKEWIWQLFRGDVEGSLWASVGDSGLHAFDAGAWPARRPPPGLPTRGPSAAFEAADGRTWLGYTQNRVYVLDAGRVQAYAAKDGLAIGRVRVIRGRGPHYWIGGELGLALFHGDRFWTLQCGGDEPLGTVSGIVELASGDLWINEMRGVVHVSAEEVQRVLRDPSHPVSFRRYDVQEGLAGAGQMNWSCSTAVEADDGCLWFATDGGLAWIHPERILLNELPPNVLILSIRTEHEKHDGIHQARLPSNTATLRIDYTALSLTIPERIRFRYRLSGYDRNWIDAGERRSAFYTRLGPGAYRFEVMAANSDGVWSETAAGASFQIAPAFYQTKWFAAACLLATLATLWLVYALRMRSVAGRLQRLHEERMDERMRIAHELHDSLLQGFVSASMQLHVARSSMPAESAANSAVDRVLHLMDEVIVEARKTVRGLRVSTTTPELEQAIARLQQEFANNSDIDFHFVVHGTLRSLRPASRDEVYCIAREGLANAFRHASARRIEVELHYLADELRLLVRDDGLGIDPVVLQVGREGHWGLPGMRERADRLGAALTVRSRIGAGTEVELSVPDRVAYTRARDGARQRAVDWARTLATLRAKQRGELR